MALFAGIDPGVNTGLAVWDTEKRMFRMVATCSILQAMFCIRLVREQFEQPVHIIFEDARQRRYIPREKNISEYRGKMMGAGSVKRDCSIWEEFAKHHVLPLVLVAPRAGMTKWDAGYFARVTGWQGRTSDHARDAAMLVYGRKNNQAERH